MIGWLILGSESCPLTAKIVITFHGSRTISNTIGFDNFDNAGLGAKGLAITSGGHIEVYFLFFFYFLSNE